jgi:hypothetical protein
LGAPLQWQKVLPPQLLKLALPKAMQLLKTTQLAAAAQLLSGTGELPG